MMEHSGDTSVNGEGRSGERPSQVAQGHRFDENGLAMRERQSPRGKFDANF